MKKLILFLLILFLPSAAMGATLVDFSDGFSETDVGDDITITSGTVSFINMESRQTGRHVYKDFGVDYFDDIRFRFEVSVTEDSTYAGPVAIAFVGDANNDSFNNMNGVGFCIDVDSDPLLSICESGSQRDSTSTVTSGAVFYVTLIREGTVLSAYIYEDAERVTLTDTLSGTVSTDAYRYLYAMSSMDLATTARETQGHIANLVLLAPIGVGDHSVEIEVTEDTWTNSGSATTNYGSNTVSLIQYGSASYRRATLLRFDLSALPSDAVIRSVELAVTIYNTPGTGIIYIFKSKRDWVESEATWNIYSTGNSFTYGGYSSNNDIYGTWNTGSGRYAEYDPVGTESEGDIAVFTNFGDAIVNAIQEEVDNETYSLNIHALAGTSNSTLRFRFYLREYTTAADRPKLTVTYDSVSESGGGGGGESSGSRLMLVM